MKAIVYTHYGSPDVLHVAEVEKPAPDDDEILVKIHAAEATKADCEMRSFIFPVKWFWLPLRIAFGMTKPKRQILGGYFAGEIVSLGRGVTHFQVGDPVFGSAQLRLGAYGEFAAYPASYTIMGKPENVSYEEAAAIPLGGLNAIHFMRKADIQAGETVLVNGAGGSIGTYAVQIAKSMGAEVTAVDSGIKAQMLRSIGADHFIDYTQEDFTQRGQTYDVIFDMVAQKSYAGRIRTLNPGGRYLMANPRFMDMVRSAFTSRFTDKQAIFAFAGETKEELLALKEMAEAGDIRPVVDKVYSMEEAAEAHHRVETEQRVGSIVIAINGFG